MYDIYLKNYINSGGSVTTSETLIYSVPILEERSYNAFIDPVIKGELGKAGTLEFLVRQSNPFYKCWQQMKTMARVVYDGTTIFRGRVLTIDNFLDGSKRLHFEGDLAFLLDTIQPGTKEENRTDISILDYLNRIIDRHNKQVSDKSDRADRKFVLGEVPGQYSNDISEEMRVKPESPKKFGTYSWTTTMAALEDLQKDYGGYFRTRYVDGVCYLDWLECVEVDNIFTAVRRENFTIISR